MTNALRFLALSLLAVLVSTGVIGCAVFSASAHGTAPEASQAEMSGMDAHAHHGMAPPEIAPAGDDHHQHESCEGCENILLNRASVPLDSGLSPVSIPAPVFIIPTAVALVPAPAAPCVHERWPPGSGPPPEPNTLTHQHISLLI